jgi:hypothetical protein
LIALTPEAGRPVEAPIHFSAERQRPQALRNLAHAHAEASLIVANAPERGLPAPRPYPELAALGLSWLKRGRYCIAYDPAASVIAGVFFETDDITGRLG